MDYYGIENAISIRFVDKIRKNLEFCQQRKILYGLKHTKCDRNHEFHDFCQHLNIMCGAQGALHGRGHRRCPPALRRSTGWRPSDSATPKQPRATVPLAGRLARPSPTARWPPRPAAPGPTPGPAAHRSPDARQPTARPAASGSARPGSPTARPGRAGRPGAVLRNGIFFANKPLRIGEFCKNSLH